MESSKKPFSQTIVESVLSLTAGVLSLLVFAWVASVMWGWFMIPAGLMAMPYTAFVGAFFLIGLANLYHVSFTKKKLEEAQETSWAFSFGMTILKIVLAGLSLGIAAIYHAFLF